MRVGELGLVDVEPLALALASVETESPAARSSGLVGSGEISGVDGFLRDQLAGPQTWTLVVCSARVFQVMMDPLQKVNVHLTI